MQNRLWLLALLSLALGCGNSLDLEEEVFQDPCLVTSPIGLGQTLGGMLQTSDCSSAGPFSDRWSITVTQATSLQIELTSDQFDPVLELRSSTNMLLASNDDSGWSWNSRIVHDIGPGEYVIVATAFQSQMTGSYQLAVTEAPDCSPLGSVQLGQGVSGSLSADDCLFDYGGRIDNWSLNMAAEGKLRFFMQSADFPAFVFLRDGAGDVFWWADEGPSGAVEFDLMLTAGDYTVSTGSYDANTTGSYDLIVDFAPPCDPGLDLVAGDTIQGSVTSSDCLFEGWVPADSFGIDIAAPTELQFHLKTPNFRPFMILRDQFGLDVGSGWDELNDGNARMRAELDSGSYSLWVGSDDYQRSGQYQLTVNSFACAEADSVSYGATVTGTLKDGDCVRSNDAFQDWWTLDLPADTTVRIDLSSTDFDTYLQLLDTAGTVLATNDDSQGGTNSRIDITLTAGRYVISASAFSVGATGAYTLSVGAPTASASPTRSTVTISKAPTEEPRPLPFALPAGPWTPRTESWLGKSPGS